MKRTQIHRRAFLDRLEKKYAKKIQLQAYRGDSDDQKRSLLSFRGKRIHNLAQEGLDFIDHPSVRLTYSS